MTDFNFVQTTNGRYDIMLGSHRVGIMGKKNNGKFDGAIKYKDITVRVHDFNDVGPCFRAVTLACKVEQLKAKFPHMKVEVPLKGGNSDIQDDANHQRALKAVSEAFAKAKKHAEVLAKDAETSRRWTA